MSTEPTGSTFSDDVVLRKQRLIWIDLEMTGLDPLADSVIEIATLVTDRELNVLAEGPSLAIRHPLSKLEAMDDWNRSHHSRSGLWQQVLDSDVDMTEAERRTLTFLQEWVEPGSSPICGNSICQDRRFLVRCMPTLERFFHYRNLDVSTVKVLAQAWAPAIAAGVVKQGAHTALSDIRESLAELRHYRAFMGPLGGHTAD